MRLIADNPASIMSAHVALAGVQPQHTKTSADASGRFGYVPVYGGHEYIRIPPSSAEERRAWPLVGVGKWELAIDVRVQGRARLRPGL